MDKKYKDKYINIAIERLKSAKDKYALRLGIYKFLASTQNSLVIKWLKNEDSALIQMICASFIHPSCYDSKAFIDLVNHFLKRSNFEPALVCIKDLSLLLRFDLIKQLNKPQKDYYGVLKNTLGKTHVTDTVGLIIYSLFHINYSTNWKILLGSDYKLANDAIAGAQKHYFSDDITWINYTDSFNHILVRKFVEFLDQKHPLAHGKTWQALKESNGKNVDYGVFLYKNNQLSKKFGVMMHGFRELHSRRSLSLTSHPYDKKTDKKAKPITPKERKELVVGLKDSYYELISELDKRLP